ncbi:MAG: hypothetical protein EBR82_82845, partial [Caulobacteraceae bacterium]|nr:hypothetical protein [Caulobacteraceae bacterium]
DSPVLNVKEFVRDAAAPFKVAVIIPAVKFPLASLATIAFAVLDAVAVVAEFSTFPEDEIVAKYVSGTAVLLLKIPVALVNTTPAVVKELMFTVPVKIGEA